MLALDDDGRAVASCADAVESLGLANVDVALLEDPALAPRGIAGVAGSLFTLPHHPNSAALLSAAAGALEPGGHLAAAVWAAPDAVPPIDHVAAALRAVSGARQEQLDAALSLGTPGALEELAAAAGLRDARVDRLRDVVRFESAAHALAVVASMYGLEEELDTLDEAALAALDETMSQRLLPYAAWDGTLVVPVEAAVLVYPVTGVE